MKTLLVEVEGSREVWLPAELQRLGHEVSRCAPGALPSCAEGMAGGLVVLHGPPEAVAALCRRVREAPACCEAVVLAVLPDGAGALAVVEAGVDDFLQESAVPALLPARLRVACRARVAATWRRDAEQGRYLLDQSSDAFYVTDAQGTLLDVSARGCELIGSSRAEALGRNLADLVPAADLARHPLRFEELRREHHVVTERRMLRKDGTAIPVEVHARTLPDARLLVIARDLTERQRSDENLARLHRLLAMRTQVSAVLLRTRDRQALFAAACAIAVEHGRFQVAWIGLVDEATRRVVPVARAGHDDGYVTTLEISIDDVPEGRGPTGTAVRTGTHQVIQDIDHDVRMLPWRELASARDFHSAGAFPLQVDGRVVGAVNLYATEADFFDGERIALLDDLAGDISYALELIAREEQRRAFQTALRHSEASFRNLIEALPDAIIVEREGRVAYVNQAAADLVGGTREGILGLDPAAFIHPDDRQRMVAGMREMVATGTPFLVHEARLVRLDGSEAVVETVGLSLLFDGRPATVVISRDLTERRQLQSRLLLAGRMASVGSLAAGVAHEINNPLAFVSANVALAGELLGSLHRALSVPDAALPARARLRDELGSLLEPLHDASVGAERIRVIVRDLKVFARGDEDRREPVDVRRVIELAVKMAWNEVRHRARLVHAFADVPPVTANESRLGQVFLNLLVNAAQAIPEGQADQNEIRIGIAQDAAGRVVVEVQDTGCGIAPEVLGRIFDPFFTTKPVGVGMGLGLSICHSIIVSLGGEITVESAPGHGSCFRVALPPASSAARVVEPRAPDAEATRRGRLLVVDDEPLMGVLIQRILEREHDVDYVSSARDALVRLAAGEVYDVILCDLMMPAMTGMDFYSELARRDPVQATRVVFLTGGAFTQRAQDFLDHVPNRCLEKPFDPVGLWPLVRSMMG